MSAIDLKQEVAKALASEWPTFAASHPNLAKALDQTLLLEPAMQSLNDDREFLDAMEMAASLGAAAETVSSIVGDVIKRWLRQLV